MDLIDFEPAVVQASWEKVLDFFEKQFNKRPSDLESILFLIGVQELGIGHKVFTKEEKQDLMHIATCKVLSYSGIYELEGLDEAGWPHWNLVNPVPSLNLKEQDLLLKAHIIHYFETEVY
jgi:hypothetical protein